MTVRVDQHTFPGSCASCLRVFADTPQPLLHRACPWLELSRKGDPNCLSCRTALGLSHCEGDYVAPLHGQGLWFGCLAHLPGWPGLDFDFATGSGGATVRPSAWSHSAAEKPPATPPPTKNKWQANKSPSICSPPSGLFLRMFGSMPLLVTCPMLKECAALGVQVLLQRGLERQIVEV